MKKVRGSYIESRDCDLLQSNSGVDQMQKHMEIDETNSTDLSSLSLISGAGYIEHPVSKFDTLAGIAIKYGVEVSDIKRMNALVTDHQMFALKSLHIPTPGKHPLSSHLPDDLDISRKASFEQNSTRLISYDPLDSFQSLRIKSSSILKTPLQAHNAHIPAICEMTAYGKLESNHLGAVDPMVTAFSPNPQLSRHRKSRSFANGFLEGMIFTDITTASNGAADSIKGNEKLVRRRQKSMADFSAATETLFNKTYTSSGGECFSVTRKSLDVRLKAAGRSGNVTNGAAAEVGKATPIVMDDVGDSFVANGMFGGRRSSSTCNLQEAEKASSSSMWSASSWSLKTDLQALSSAVVTKSLFEGMPRSSSTRFKASMD